ncbi:MAG: PqqD family protein [Mariprofundaceae bacterium]|nr:PqqD family protein [Mariprofundaceae bacterium]
MQQPEFPEKIPGLIGEELEGLDEMIYVRSEDGASFSLNMTASAVLEMCDGKLSRADIVQRLGSILPEGQAPAPAQLSADVDAILADFVENGLIYADDKDAD